MSAGKGDKPRPVDGDKFRSNYDAIFRKGKDKRQKDKKNTASHRRN